MSSRKSEARKIIRKANRMKKRQKTLVEKHRKPGETDEEMEKRLKGDLGNWLEMMTEREVEEALTAKATELKAVEDAQALTDTKEENN